MSLFVFLLTIMLISFIWCKRLCVCITLLLDNPDFVKYLRIHIDNRLNWNYQVKHVTQKCCQHIGIYKKVLACLSKYAAILYSDAFFRSCLSHCVMLGFTMIVQVNVN